MFYLKSGREELHSIYLMYFVKGIRFGLTKVLIKITRKTSKKKNRFLIGNILMVFIVHIKHYGHFPGVTAKQCYTLFQTSNNADIFRELLGNNTTNFSKFHVIIKPC